MKYAASLRKWLILEPVGGKHPINVLDEAFDTIVEERVHCSS